MIFKKIRDIIINEEGKEERKNKMGASSFGVIAYGYDKNQLENAYNDACAEAKEYFGDDPYNGTISTTVKCNVSPNSKLEPISSEYAREISAKELDKMQKYDCRGIYTYYGEWENKDYFKVNELEIEITPKEVENEYNAFRNSEEGKYYPNMQPSNFLRTVAMKKANIILTEKTQEENNEYNVIISSSNSKVEMNYANIEKVTGKENVYKMNGTAYTYDYVEDKEKAGWYMFGWAAS